MTHTVSRLTCLYSKYIYINSIIYKGHYEYFRERARNSGTPGTVGTLLAEATCDDAGHRGQALADTLPGNLLHVCRMTCYRAVVAFTKSPYKLSRVQSLRVETGFPAKLAEASKRAGVPNGVLLDRLVDQYLESEGDDEGLSAIAKLAEARERVRELNQILDVGITIGQLNAVGHAAPPEVDLSPMAFEEGHEARDDHAGSDADGDDESSTDTEDGFWNGTSTDD